MKVLLLNDAGYGDMGKVTFPVEVEANHVLGSLYLVKGSEILRIAGQCAEDEWDPNWGYSFIMGKHLKVTEDI